jgi:SAM-dependent methyltransferase
MTSGKRDLRYQRKLPYRGRGHADLALRTGGIFADIDARLQHQDVVRVLELGCGFGTVLLELCQRYGARVHAHGINREPGDGDAELLLRHGVACGLIVGDATADIPLPTISHGDVARGLPFADESFDIVYSQVAWMYFGNKIAVLREVCRVLRGDGIGRIDADELRSGLPPEYARLVEIWNDGVNVPFGHYLRRYGIAFVPAVDGEYLELRKASGVGDDLDLLYEIDLARLHVHWDGIKCVYRQVAG